MGTTLGVRGETFLVNDRPTYAEIAGGNPSTRGLLMNARFIQGIFDDHNGRSRYARFGRDRFDPEENTASLIRALPEWYRYGLRAFTVGLQGGMPVFTTDNALIDNNPYSEDGTRISPDYLRRLEALVAAADAVGMIVIVSLLYQGQAPRMSDDAAVRNAVVTAARFLKELGRPNVVIEVANEQDVGEFARHPIVWDPPNAAALVELARAESGGLPTGCSSAGGHLHRVIAEASDIILIHGNGCTRQQYHALIKRARGFGLNRPIVCNEDSPCVGQLTVAFNSATSWGYYNNLTKQEPPADWSVTPGEDLYFARRLAGGLGIPVNPTGFDERFLLQGFEPHMTVGGRRWVRVASEAPELIDYVQYFHDGLLVDVAYDEPFFLNATSTWTCEPIDASASGGGEWVAQIHLRDGRLLERRAQAR